MHSCYRILLTQYQYIVNLLHNLDLANLELTNSPMEECSDLKDSKDALGSKQAMKYQKLVGSLQYLTLTHPDISFLINKLSQYMSHPTTAHWMTSQCVLQYLSSTFYHGIHIKKLLSSSLIGYSDSDWTGDS